MTQTLNGVGNSAPIGQHTAKPTVIDVILAATTGVFGDRPGSPALGADKENTATACSDISDLGKGPIEHRHGLLKIENMNPVAGAKNIRRHLGVPATGVMAEMNASFEELTHGIRRNRHCSVSFSG